MNTLILTDRRKSALDAFAATQAELRTLEGTRLLGHDRIRLWQWQVAWPYIDAFSAQTVKRFQLDAADGRPLTVCVGRRSRDVPIAPDETVSVFHGAGDGCGVVYPDSTSTRGRNPFRACCPACTLRTTDRKRKVRSQLLAHIAGREQVVHGVNEDGRPGHAWFGTCQSCGEPFTNTRPDAKQCERCR